MAIVEKRNPAHIMTSIVLAILCLRKYTAPRRNVRIPPAKSSRGVNMDIIMSMFEDNSVRQNTYSLSSAASIASAPKNMLQKTAGITTMLLIIIERNFSNVDAGSSIYEAPILLSVMCP